MARAVDGHGVRCSLAMLMASQRVTVRGLSAETGIHAAAISKLRNGHFQMVDCQTIERLARHFKVPIGDLLYLDPPIDGEES
jgi:DNA-binding Xre family transcriptional regulator